MSETDEKLIYGSLQVHSASRAVYVNEQEIRSMIKVGILPVIAQSLS